MAGRTTSPVSTALALSHSLYSTGIATAPVSEAVTPGPVGIALVPHMPTPGNRGLVNFLTTGNPSSPSPASVPPAAPVDGSIDPTTGIPYATELAQINQGMYGGGYSGGGGWQSSAPDFEDDGYDDVFDDSFDFADDDMMGVVGAPPHQAASHAAVVAVTQKAKAVIAKAQNAKTKARSTVKSVTGKALPGSSLLSKLVTVRKPVTSLRGDVSEILGDATSDALIAIDNQVQSLQGQLQTLTGQDAQLQGSVSQAQTDWSNISSQADQNKLADIIASTNGGQSGASGQYYGMAGNAIYQLYSAYANQIAAIQAQDAQVQQNASNVSATIDNLNATIDSMNQAMSNLASQQQTYQQSVAQSQQLQAQIASNNIPTYTPPTPIPGYTTPTAPAPMYYDPSQYAYQPDYSSYQQPNGYSGPSTYVPDAEFDDGSEYADTGLDDADFGD